MAVAASRFHVELMCSAHSGKPRLTKKVTLVWMPVCSYQGKDHLFFHREQSSSRGWPPWTWPVRLEGQAILPSGFRWWWHLRTFEDEMTVLYVLWGVSLERSACLCPPVQGDWQDQALGLPYPLLKQGLERSRGTGWYNRKDCAQSARWAYLSLATLSTALGLSLNM